MTPPKPRAAVLICGRGSNMMSLVEAARAERPRTHRDLCYNHNTKGRRMTLTLPADPETERLARKPAQVTGQSLPVVVRDAIVAKAEAAGVVASKHVSLSREELLARMTEITDGFASLPVLDARTSDEIIGYDEHGVLR